MSTTTTIDRRTLIQALLRSGVALGLMPGFAENAWSAIAADGAPSAPRALSAAQTVIVGIIADTILPRSDTPGATDVGVPAWIGLIVAEYFSETRRAAFLADLTAIDDFALTSAGARVSALTAEALIPVIANLDAAVAAKDPSAAQRGYAQLKDLVIYGYFTSKPVQQDILQVVIIPGRFDANLPFASAT